MRRTRRNLRSEGISLALCQEILLGTLDGIKRTLLALLRGGAPSGQTVATEYAAHGIRVLCLNGRDIEAELESWTPPVHTHDFVAEAILRERGAIDARGEGDDGIGMQVIDVIRIDESMHGGIDRRRSAAAAHEAMVETLNHLVFELESAVDGLQASQALDIERRKSASLECAEVATGTLHIHDERLLTRCRVELHALGRSIAAGVVRVLGIGTEPVAASQQIVNKVSHYAPHPACAPPTRSSLIFF